MILEVPLMNIKDIEMKYVDAEEPIDRPTAELLRDQSLLLHDIEEIYQNFDSEIEFLSNSSLEIAFKLKFMEMHYLVIYQELTIIGQFEEPEKLLFETIGDLTMQMKRIEEEIKGFKFKLKEFIGLEQCSQTSKGSLDSINSFFKSNGCLFLSFQFH